MALLSGVVWGSSVFLPNMITFCYNIFETSATVCYSMCVTSKSTFCFVVWLWVVLGLAWVCFGVALFKFWWNFVIAHGSFISGAVYYS
jgi:hypothetical protein